MATLTNEPLASLPDRLFAEAEAPASPQVRATLASTSPQERAAASASTTDAEYLRFYSRCAGARSIVEFGTSFGISIL